MARCLKCRRKLQGVDYIEGLGEILWCENCHQTYYLDEDEGELDVYEPLSDDEAEDIYLSSGMDEDYDFRS